MKRPRGTSAEPSNQPAFSDSGGGEVGDGLADLLGEARVVEPGTGGVWSPVALRIAEALDVEAQNRHAPRGPPARNLDPHPIRSGVPHGAAV